MAARRTDRLVALRAEITSEHPQRRVVLHALDVNDHDRVFEVTREAAGELGGLDRELRRSARPDRGAEGEGLRARLAVAPDRLGDARAAAVGRAAARVNQEQPVRQEDAFDVASLVAWLREHVVDPTGLDVVPQVRQFAGGVSNLTYLLRFPDRDLVLRRPPAGTKPLTAHDMGREVRIQRALISAFPYVPQVHAYCPDDAVIGTPFYVMERLQGTILRRDLPARLAADRDRVHRMCTNVVDLLVRLHEVDPAAVGLDDLGRGRGYVARQVAGWSQRYQAARTPETGALDDVVAWLRDRQPADSGSCLIHNDFRLDNVVLSDDDLAVPAGLLDWEMATVGDPFLDLGSALAYWVQADDDEEYLAFRLQPTHVAGMLTRDQVVAQYCERTGRTLAVGSWTFYEVFGLFRLAVIAQQVYYRYYHGQTTNPAFARFDSAVHMLERRCRGLLAAADR